MSKRQCKVCNGTGVLPKPDIEPDRYWWPKSERCFACKGTGRQPSQEGEG